jgi:hypothetical protein
MTLVMDMAIGMRRPPVEVSRIHRIPARGPGYSSYEIPLSREELARYTKAFVIKRGYRMGSSRFLLMVIDGRGNRYAVHDPIPCITGAGWQIRAREPARIKGGCCTVLHLKNGASGKYAAYWFSTGGTRHASVVRSWLQSAASRITLGRSGREPILVILQTVEGSPENLAEIMNRFGPLFEV